jgi:hypothetical protein
MHWKNNRGQHEDQQEAASPNHKQLLSLIVMPPTNAIFFSRQSTKSLPHQ